MEKQIIYKNPLSCPEDVKDFIMEGKADVYFVNQKMRMKNRLSENEGQKSNFVYWCPEEFPSDIEISWKFRPIKEPGLCIMFLSAKGINGEDLFDYSLSPRDGQYGQYTHGDINTYHISYFRHKWDRERCFHTCNLRKSNGFHLVCQGADPLPNCEDAKEFYELKIIKYKGRIVFFIDELNIFSWQDDGNEYGKVLDGGKIGFRQMAPLIGEYSDLKVYSLNKKL